MRRIPIAIALATSPEERQEELARLGTGLPNTPVLDVKLSGDGSTLFAATFGRSVWKIALP